MRYDIYMYIYIYIYIYVIRRLKVKRQTRDADKQYVAVSRQFVFETNPGRISPAPSAML